MSGIKRELPNNEYEAAINAAFPSAGNPFTTASQVPFRSRIVVTQLNISTTLGGTIDSTKLYFIDGIINCTGVSCEIPAGGLNIGGDGIKVSKLFSPDIAYTMFTSPIGGSGDIDFNGVTLEVTGLGSKLYDLVGATGNEFYEVKLVNFDNCTAKGRIDNYRQGLETGSGRIGGTPTLELIGAWSGGYRTTTSIVRFLSAGMTEPIFKAGAGFVMESRFLTDINCDLPALAALIDFGPANFPNPSTLQLKGCIVTRNGVFDSSDANISPNITQKDLASDWDNNVGVPNTFIGGIKTVSVEVETVISLRDTPTIILGTFITSDLQHFDQNFNYSLRHLGTDPKDFRVTFDFVLEGAQDDQYRVHLMRDRGGVITSQYTQTRTIDRLAGGRDVTYFNGTFGVTIEQNDFLYWEVENITTAANCTLELDSQWLIEER